MKLTFLLISSLLISSIHLQSYSILQEQFGLKTIPPDAKLTPKQLIQKYGYPYEQHNVTTQDGYILTVFRIKHGKSSTSGDPNPNPVFFQHGLLATAHCWITNTAELSPAFMLADAGFDVWLGNNRGTTFSRHHQTLDPDKDSQYWQFSFVDFARYDVKGQLAYVREQTGKKVGYIGHSQGTIQMFTALSQYQDWLSQNITAYAAVAPVARVGNMESTLLQFLAHSQIAPLIKFLGFNEFLPRRWIINNFAEWICSDMTDLCKIGLYLLVDALPIEDNLTQVAVALNYLPGGTSVLNMNHWSQLVTSKKFQYYDYGKKENQKKYGQDTPPLIDLSKLNKVAIGIFSGAQDELADPTDVKWLTGVLEGTGVMKFNKQYEDGHFTFIIGEKMAYVADLITFMKGYVDDDIEQV